MDYQGRLRRVQQAMAERDIAVMFLPRAANLFYLAGIRRHLEHGTDHNAYGDWLSGGYLGQTGPMRMVVPRMGGGFFMEEARDQPWISDVRPILEPVDPAAVLRETLAGFGVGAGRSRIAVDERSWAQLTIAIRSLFPDAEIVNANEIIAPMRMIKDDDELAAMQRASDVADAVFDAVMPQLRPGVSELDISHEIDLQFIRHGAEYTSFETGVFFNGKRPDSAGQTTRSGGRTLQPGDSVMFDFGGVVDGYCSDFGRSAFVGEPPAEYLRAHEAVIKAQADAMAAMAAGRCTAAEANRIARAVIADAGFDDGFTHRLGHGIGVTVHEPPFLDGVDEIVLQDRMTFTVEPSIMYPNRFGNRIEDVVRVTPEGGVPLGRIERRLFVID